eukprot:TRINITY_DN16970_c0_g1_i1.p1 TRINITY_DN16970_c0_g1~~TRINITY_DN16970_c0_g1_i1.p1  ORF type:complete len:320 (-),score=55.73 TRINITY_DN16970_c0_g1_i1:237-1124(-)
MAAETIDCAICLEAHSGDLMYKAPCNHHFHFECLRSVFVASAGAEFRCPLCRADLESAAMDFRAFHSERPAAVWQWSLTESDSDAGADSGSSTRHVEEWMRFPVQHYAALEAARESSETCVQLGAAGSVSLSDMLFTPARSPTEEEHVGCKKSFRVRRCECIWTVRGFHSDAAAPGGCCLRQPAYYEAAVSQFLEDAYQRYLQDPACDTITDPSGSYVYNFRRQAAAVNPKLVAMFQWPAGQPRRARVISRHGDVETDPVIADDERGDEQEAQEDAGADRQREEDEDAGADRSAS